MSLRDQLQAIYDKNERLTPALVVDAARPVGHPLHNSFEWNDKAAGEQYRLDQARRLIRSVRVVYREADEQEAARTVRAYHSVRDDQGTAYKPTDEIVESELLTKIILQDMQREWLQLKRRYGHFAEFIAMVRGDFGEQEAA